MFVAVEPKSRAPETMAPEFSCSGCPRSDSNSWQSKGSHDRRQDAINAVKSRTPAATETCIVAKPTASCCPANVNKAATTSIKTAVRSNEDTTAGTFSFRKNRCAGCNRVANNAATSTGIISSEICDSNQIATALMMMMSNIRQDHAAATATP